MRYDLWISGLSSVLWADAGAYSCARFYRWTSLPPRGTRHEGLAFWVLLGSWSFYSTMGRRPSMVSCIPKRNPNAKLSR